MLNRDMYRYIKIYIIFIIAFSILNFSYIQTSPAENKIIEKNPPEISNITITPKNISQGDQVLIKSKVIDDSGLKNINISITTPKNETYSGNMIRKKDNIFAYTFKKTSNVGNYTIIIEATDISIPLNNANKTKKLHVYKDSTLPNIHFYGAQPSVQLKNKTVCITCTAIDELGIKNVEVSITHPDGYISKKNMDFTPEGKYVYKNIYEKCGEYIFNIKLEDKANNTIKTNNKTFWITTKINDTDNDKIPDTWEEKYNLDPKNTEDAQKDSDNDGYTNFEEYKTDNHPKKAIFTQNAAQRIKNNQLYLLISTILFVIISLLSIFGVRRKITRTKVSLLLTTITFIVFLLSIWDIIFDKGWITTIIAAYTIILILTLSFIIFKKQNFSTNEYTIENFEKKLKGALYHYKCPECKGIFAIKKSKRNNKKPFRLTCPDCGTIGLITSSTTQYIKENIPEKKSLGINFECINCGEGVTLWAEGSELYPKIKLYSCPFCGKENSMTKVS